MTGRRRLWAWLTRLEESPPNEPLAAFDPERPDDPPRPVVIHTLQTMDGKTYTYETPEDEGDES